MFEWFSKRSSEKEPAKPAESHTVPETVRVIKQDGYRIELDRAGQVLELASPPSYRFSELVPTLSDLRPTAGRFVSASVLAQKAKQFDDGLYAAVELAAQSGAGSFRGKAWLLKTITQQLDGMPPGRTAGALYGAAQLGGLDVEVPVPLQACKQEQIAGFLGDELRSKPISFYTYSDELKGIFQQDRLLQQPLVDDQAIDQLVHVLKNKETWSAYEGWLHLASKLTNRFKGRDLRRWPLQPAKVATGSDEDDVHFLPPSRSYETDLVKRLYANTPIPEGFNLAEELIAAVRDGRVSLEPKDDSGWYDLQTWSLEPLLLPNVGPEGGCLQMEEDYGKRLQELFKGSLALTRETHIKQLEMVTAGAAGGIGFVPESPTITVRPDLSVEPLYSYYLRRAIGYRFVRDVLELTFGASALESFSRVTPNGRVSTPLSEELDQVSGLFYGAATLVSEELGFTASERAEMEASDLKRVCVAAQPGEVSLGSGHGAEADARLLRAWAQELSTDHDLNQDCRMMVPIFCDLDRQKTKAWVFLGWSSEPLFVSFVGRPSMRVFDSHGNSAEDKVRVQPAGQYESPAYPVTAEIYVSRLMDRDEFRAHCDRHRTREAILDNLS